MRYLACALLVLAFSMPAFAQLTVNVSVPDNELAQSLVGEGVIITNVTVTCPTGAYGAFNGTNVPSLGIDSGLLLTSGAAFEAVGPNDVGSNSIIHNNGFTDPDLQAIADPFPVRDACIFEFDVEPLGDTIRFNFVFGSEEYPEYTCSDFNDVFGFFISGPDPNGGNFVNKNIAIIPGTNIPVAINSVNQGSPGANGTNGNCISTAYSNYYFDNGDASTCIFPFGQAPHCTDISVLQYDGFTQGLFAQSEVEPCQVYHLKLAVSDVGDSLFDSGVFIERISSNRQVSVTATTAGGGGTLNAIEGCNDGNIQLIKTPVENVPVVFNLLVSGTAVNGVDYQTIPTSVTFLPGDTVVDIPIVTIVDGLTEPVETIDVFLLSQCSSVPFNTVSLFVLDQLPVDIVDDTLFSCPNVPVPLSATGGVQYSWSPPTGLSNTNTANTTATIGATTTYTVTGTFAGCTATDEVTIVVSTATNATISPDTSICDGGSVQLVATGGVTYSWTPTTGLSNASIANPVASPTATTQYDVTITDNCGNNNNLSVTVTVVPFAGVTIAGLDPTYCSGDAAVTLTGTPAGGTFSGTGISGNSFDPAAAGIGGPYTITYTYTDPQAGCTATVDTVTTVFNGPAVSFSGLLDQYCEGDAASTLTLTPNGGTLTGTGIVGSSFDPALAGVGGPYIITYDVSNPQGCPSTFRDTTAVNALPVLSIQGLLPQYCLGDPASTLTVSPSGVGGTLSGPGISSLDFTPAAAGIGGPYTITYDYTDPQTGCSGTVDTLTTVDAGPVTTVSGYDAAYCEDEPIVNLVLNPVGGTLNGNGFFGTIFNPGQAGAGEHTFTYSVSNPTGCPGFFTDTITVNAVPIPVLDPNGGQQLCEGETLTVSTGNFNSYVWSTNETTQSITVSDSGSYWVEVTSDEGCVGVSDTILVNVNPIPAVVAGPDTQINLGSSIQLSAITSPATGVNLVWTPGADLDCINCPDPIASPLFTTDFVVNIELNGCIGAPDTASIIVVEREFFIPSGFTPNGDGSNDGFQIIDNGAVEVLELKIYNRWGELVFDNPNKSWDGTYKDEPQPMGAFTYYGIVVDKRGTKELVSGTITLIR